MKLQSLLLTLSLPLIITGATASRALGQSATIAAYDTIPYPRFWTFNMISGTGKPFTAQIGSGACKTSQVPCTYWYDCGGDSCIGVASNAGTPPVVNKNMIRHVARFPLSVISADDLNLSDSVRAVNANAHIWAYVIPTYINGFNTTPHDTTITNWRAWRAIERYDSLFAQHYYTCVPGGPGFLWLTNGQSGFLNNGMNVNLAYCVSGTYPIADSLADLYFLELCASGRFNGLWLDMFSQTFHWSDTGSPAPVDYVRAGYADWQSFEVGWSNAHVELLTRLRSKLASASMANFPLLGNGGEAHLSDLPLANGWYRENFPYQDGGTWDTNLYNYPGGYAFADSAFVQPQISPIGTWPDPYWEPYTSSNQRKMRFGLGTAALEGGYSGFEENTAFWYKAPDFDWWYDELAVALPSLVADTLHTGWLGHPLGASYQAVWSNANTNLTGSGTFESGYGGWTFTTNGESNGSSSIEAGTEPEGSHAVHLAVTQIKVDANGDTLEWCYQLYSGKAYLASSQEYTVTFWAKANAERRIGVYVESPAAGHELPLTTSWKQYQVVLAPASSDSGRVRFYVGAVAGEVWLDDITVKAGVTSVYRRDFQNGIVLVNPYSAAQTVTLEKSYKRINGTVNAALNDGSVVNVVTVAGSSSGSGVGDAAFLVTDKVRPCAVTDLQGSPGKTTVLLEWTAPGDDSLAGTATEYDVRRSASNITSGNFASATAVTSVTPSAAGSHECFSATGLSQSHTYYFALKTKDGGDNWSAMSNVVQVTTNSSGGEPMCQLGDRARPSGAEEAPMVMSLGAPSPNPARKTISLRYGVPSSGVGAPYELAVFDVLGRKVRVLGQGLAGAGRFVAAWDLNERTGRKAHPGVYYVRFRLGQETMSRVLTVLQ